MQPVIAVFSLHNLLSGGAGLLCTLFFRTFVFDQFSSHHKLYVSNRFYTRTTLKCFNFLNVLWLGLFAGQSYLGVHSASMPSDRAAVSCALCAVSYILHACGTFLCHVPAESYLCTWKGTGSAKFPPLNAAGTWQYGAPMDPWQASELRCWPCCDCITTPNEPWHAFPLLLHATQ